MKTTHWLALLVLPASLLLAGCKGGESKGPAEKDYPIKGKVVSVDPDKASGTLDHEEIPGLMKAMKMDYRVQNLNFLQDIKADDQVQGRLKVESGKYIITQLEKTQSEKH